MAFLTAAQPEQEKRMAKRYAIHTLQINNSSINFNVCLHLQCSLFLGRRATVNYIYIARYFCAPPSDLTPSPPSPSPLHLARLSSFHFEFIRDSPAAQRMPCLWWPFSVFRVIRSGPLCQNTRTRIQTHKHTNTHAHIIYAHSTL